MLLRLTLSITDKNALFHTIQLILANFVLQIYFLRHVYIGNSTAMLDTAKQSTYFTINEAKHAHFGNGVILQEKPLLGYIRSIIIN